MTINELARIANVSKSTVSKVLNNRPGVGRKTRERILELSADLEYIPNSTAKALADKKTSTIGLVIPYETSVSLNDEFWSVITSSITKYAGRKNYNIMLFTPERQSKLSNVVDNIIRSGKTDGIIMGGELVDDESFKKLEATSLPYVLIGRNPRYSHCYVDIDNYAASKEMTEQIISCGYTHPAFICGPLEYYYNCERLNGFTQTLRARGLEYGVESTSRYDRELVHRAVDTLFERHPDTDSLFIGAGGDFMFDVLRRLKDTGIGMDDLGLAVFDDFQYLDFLSPAPTAVRQPYEQLGKEATNMLLSLIDRKIPSRKTIILNAEIHYRGSLIDDSETEDEPEKSVSLA